MSVAVEMLQPEFRMKPNCNTYDDERQQHSLQHQFSLIYLDQIEFIESICLILGYSVKADLFLFFPQTCMDSFYVLHSSLFYINFI